VRNLTVTVPDTVYRSARIRAAERGTSVSAMVSEYLCGLGVGERDEQSLSEFFRELAARNPQFDPADNLPRDQLHDRALR